MRLCNNSAHASYRCERDRREGLREAGPEERETAARLTALMRHLFLYDRGNQLRVMEETGLSLTQCKAILEIGGLGEALPAAS